MQYYHAQQRGSGAGAESYQGYSLHPAAVAAAARMQWNPNSAMHHPSQWNPYDFYQGGYHGHHLAAATSISAVSPDHAATPHNIRDILGGQGQTGGETLVSEVAKTPSYQKSPTSAAAVGTVFHYPSPQQQQLDVVRSPTTPTADFAPPHGFYVPAIPGRPFGE